VGAGEEIDLVEQVTSWMMMASAHSPARGWIDGCRCGRTTRLGPMRSDEARERLGW